jgi:hypothetical protein
MFHLLETKPALVAPGDSEWEFFSQRVWVPE